MAKKKKETWFHYPAFSENSILRPLRVCGGHTRGTEGVTPCSYIKATEGK